MPTLTVQPTPLKIVKQEPKILRLVDVFVVMALKRYNRVARLCKATILVPAGWRNPVNLLSRQRATMDGATGKFFTTLL